MDSNSAECLVIRGKLLSGLQYPVVLILVCGMVLPNHSRSATVAALPCSVPAQPGNQPWLLQPASSYTPDNPMAGTLYRMTFPTVEVDKYHYTILSSGKQYTGTYTYKRSGNNIAILNAEEIFEGIPTHYTMTLVCENDRHGTYIYQQQQGKSGIRSNTGHYYLDIP